MKVKIQTYNGEFSGYKVNENSFFPKENCELVKQWIAEGNNPEAEFTDEEVAAKLAVETYNITKAAKEIALNSITVEVNGKVFDGRAKDQVNIMAAIQASEVLGETSTEWVLNDNSKAVVTVGDLKMVLALSIQKVGQIVKGEI